MYASANFERLVLCRINADCCNQRLIRQRFSRSTTFSEFSHFSQNSGRFFQAFSPRIPTFAPGLSMKSSRNSEIFRQSSSIFAQILMYVSEIHATFQSSSTSSKCFGNVWDLQFVNFLQKRYAGMVRFNTITRLGRFRRYGPVW